MTVIDSPTIYARVYVDRIVWFLSSCGELVGHGVVKTYGELRLQQVVAGVLVVLLDAQGKGFHLPANLTYGGEWRVATDLDREQLENFFALANRTFSEATPEQARQI